MGLFGNGKTCSICGEKAGLLSRMKLQDGGYVCADCQMKVSDQIRMDDYKQMTKADFEKCLKDTFANGKKYQTEFTETYAITAGSGHKVLSVDETHRWWVCPEYNRPIVFSLDDIESWSVRMDTAADSEDNQDKGLMDMFNQFAQSSYFASLRANHPELPYCPTGYHATGMKVYISVSNPYIREAVIDIWKPGWFSDSNEDLQNAYNTAIQMIEYFQKIKRQDNSQLKTSGTSYQRMGQPQADSQSVSASDPAAELRKYKSLLDDGIISQEDFDAKKKQLLGL